MSTTGEVPIADIVPTADEVTRLLAERPDCWQWAAFASVLFQRWAAVEERRVRVALGHRDRPSARLRTDRECALFVRMRIRDCDELVRDCDAFMRAPGFMDVFGDPSDESTVDGDGVLRVAHRLADYYERHIELAEESRDCVVPDRHLELLRNCTALLSAPLRDFGDFINDVLERFDEMRRRAVAGDHVIVLKPVLMRTTTEERLVWAILDRLSDIA